MNHVNPTRPLSPEELRTAFNRVLDRGDPQAEDQAAAAASGPGAAAAPAAPRAALDLQALMGLGDREFVEKAYASILKRRPDEPGIRHYVGVLNAGRSRISVIGELRYSAEGKAAGIPVPGLRRRYLLHRCYRLPLFGRLLRTLTGLVALPGLLRDVARLSTELRSLRIEGEHTDRAIENEMRSRADFAEQAIERAAERERQTVRAQAARVDQLDRRLGAEPWADPLLALAGRLEEQFARMDQLNRAFEASTDRARELARLSEALAAMQEGLGWPERGAALGRRVEATLSEQRNLAARAVSAAENNQAGLRDQERRLSLILAEIRHWMAHGPGADAPARISEHQDHLLDPLYLAFEDRFRGSRADIKQRQRVYLDLLKQAGAGAAGRPIVDVGSGRGELLELLAEERLASRGVDLNEAMVSLCTRAGLDCVQDDAVAYLSRLEPGSLGAVTGFHIIEHLPFAVMVALFDASLRALASGGIVVFETPNPANLMVASRWFHLDPTHRNPLPSEMVAMIAEARGFVAVSIRELHPMQRRFEARDEVLAGQLDAIFHGPQDYALIARKA